LQNEQKEESHPYLIFAIKTKSGCSTKSYWGKI